jgi:hypothetical protein
MTFSNYPPEDDGSESDDGLPDAEAIERTRLLRLENLRLRSQHEAQNRQLQEEREKAAIIKNELARLEKDLQERRNRRK